MLQRPMEAACKALYLCTWKMPSYNVAYNEVRNAFSLRGAYFPGNCLADTPVLKSASSSESPYPVFCEHFEGMILLVSYRIF